VSGVLGNVRSYEFGDYEVVHYCVIHSSWEVGGERGVSKGEVVLCHYYGVGVLGTGVIEVCFPFYCVSPRMLMV